MWVGVTGCGVCVGGNRAWGRWSRAGSGGGVVCVPTFVCAWVGVGWGADVGRARGVLVGRGRAIVTRLGCHSGISGRARQGGSAHNKSA